MQKKNLLLVAPLIVIAGILLVSLIVSLGVPLSPLSEKHCECHYMIPNSFYLIFGILLVAATVPISYYFIWKKTAEKLDKQMEILSRMVNADEPSSRRIIGAVTEKSILKLLNNIEREVLERLLGRKDGVLQSELSKIPGMTKLKVHRAVKSLEQKGIIAVERYGKTNKICLTNDIESLVSG